MSTTETETKQELALMPVTAEVVNLDDPNACARALDTLRTISDEVATAKRILSRALAEHARVQGGNTMRIDAAEVKVSTPVTIEWNVEILRELVAAGLPTHRWNELVEQTIDYKVKAAVAKQIAKANPEYAEIVGRAETRREGSPSVSVAMRAPETT